MLLPARYNTASLAYLMMPEFLGKSTLSFTKILNYKEPRMDPCERHK